MLAELYQLQLELQAVAVTLLVVFDEFVGLVG